MQQLNSTQRSAASDLFGFIPQQEPKGPFKDIPSMRPSVAEEKAMLCLELNRLIKKIPTSIHSASINTTHKWLDTRKKRMSVLNSKASSRTELQTAINRLRAFEEMQ